ncbi:hypothetical protein K1719_039378 [Acacia pycnantha]|nr:hypothetical protein K1719_039378 [Acacia pycnantha]
MTNWAIELSEFDITYEARHAIKSQALADFIRELTPASKSDETMAGEWKVYVDGSSNTKGSGPESLLRVREGLQLSIRCISTSQLRTIKRIRGLDSRASSSQGK